MSESEVSRLKSQIEQEYLAALNGIAGLAFGTSRHEFIAARMENMGRYCQQLNTLVDEQEVKKILAETLEAL